MLALFSVSWCWYALGSVCLCIILFARIFSQRAPRLTLNASTRVLIPGGTSGIGLATAVALARLGCSVVIVGRNKKRCQDALAAVEAARAHPEQVLTAESGDVSDYANIARATDAAARPMGGIDVLINSAGVSRPGRYRFS